MKTQPRLVHEAEVQRQHARLRIPIVVEFGNTKTRALDWSHGGFSVMARSRPSIAKTRMAMSLRFDLDGFVLTLAMTAEMRRVTPIEEGAFQIGFEFVDVNAQQASALRYLYDAYLSGEIVQAGDILAIVGRENAAKERRNDVAALTEETNPWTTKRIATVLSMAAVVLVVCSYAARAVYDQLFTLYATSAEVTSEMVHLRAPINGVMSSYEVAPGQSIDVGQTIAVLSQVNGSTTELLSPCDCWVQDLKAVDRAYVGQGDPLVSLVKRDAAIVVEATFPAETVNSLEGGEEASVRVVGTGETVSGEPQSSRFEQSTGALVVTIDPDQPFTLRDIGQPADVSLDTFALGSSTFLFGN